MLSMSTSNLVEFVGSFPKLTVAFILPVDIILTISALPCHPFYTASFLPPKLSTCAYGGNIMLYSHFRATWPYWNNLRIDLHVS